MKERGWFKEDVVINSDDGVTKFKVAKVREERGEGIAKTYARTLLRIHVPAEI